MNHDLFFQSLTSFISRTDNTVNEIIGMNNSSLQLFESKYETKIPTVLNSLLLNFGEKFSFYSNSRLDYTPTTKHLEIAQNLYLDSSLMDSISKDVFPFYYDDSRGQLLAIDLTCSKKEVLMISEVYPNQNGKLEPDCDQQINSYYSIVDIVREQFFLLIKRILIKDSLALIADFSNICWIQFLKQEMKIPYNPNLIQRSRADFKKN